jgi:hypothetical protein
VPKLDGVRPAADFLPLSLAMLYESPKLFNTEDSRDRVKSRIAGVSFMFLSIVSL